MSLVEEIKLILLNLCVYIYTCVYEHLKDIWSINIYVYIHILIVDLLNVHIDNVKLVCILYVFHIFQFLFLSPLFVVLVLPNHGYKDKITLTL